VLSAGVTLRRVEEGIWSVLPPSLEAQRYDAIAARYDRLIGSRLYQRLVWGNRLADDTAFAREAVGSDAEGAILDAGCGSLLSTTDAHLAGERPTVLLDLSVGMLRRAKARIVAKAGALPERIVLLQADVLRLPFRPACFRTVLCPGILHVFADPGALVRSLDSVLESEGALYISCLVTDRAVGRAWMRLLARGDDVQSLLTAAAVEGLVEETSGRATDCRAKGNVARLCAGAAEPSV
jgi:ubiquinone/menaquinone biosynthesis C-methylase UbiE